MFRICVLGNDRQQQQGQQQGNIDLKVSCLIFRVLLLPGFTKQTRTTPCHA